MQQRENHQLCYLTVMLRGIYDLWLAYLDGSARRRLCSAARSLRNVECLHFQGEILNRVTNPNLALRFFPQLDLPHRGPFLHLWPGLRCGQVFVNDRLSFIYWTFRLDKSQRELTCHVSFVERTQTLSVSWAHNPQAKKFVLGKRDPWQCILQSLPSSLQE